MRASLSQFLSLGKEQLLKLKMEELRISRAPLFFPKEIPFLVSRL
jgi:hypothetical protein